ncbi:aldehyde dehydrogenase family protein [Mycobacterium xenopi 3993]|nr:aldehyde dehydrogenase family protein [Mycobacterium xenopi 3993]
MTNEIFGPILPVITVESLDDAIRFVNSRPSRCRRICSPRPAPCASGSSRRCPRGYARQPPRVPGVDG